jgi:hypothetical protein
MSDDHDIDGACYSLRPEWRRHVPALLCSCGKGFYGETWAEAGEEYDEHLDTARIAKERGVK